jgi:phosphoglycolate phosphatase-like HAD superfamily hydrolase
MESKQKKIIVVDFSGTLVKGFLVEKANLLRYKILDIPAPNDKKHKKMHATKSHYNDIKTHLEKVCGIKKNMTIKYNEIKGKQITLTGEEIETTLFTDMFKYCMYHTANLYGQKIYDKNFLLALKKIKKSGYKLAIVSGIRTDIVSGILQITNCPIKFDYIYGQDPVLSQDDNLKQIITLTKIGKIFYIIGDKMSDIKPSKKVNAKSIFVTWGHPTGNEEKFANYTISKGKELLQIIK